MSAENIEPSFKEIIPTEIETITAVDLRIVDYINDGVFKSYANCDFINNSKLEICAGRFMLLNLFANHQYKEIGARVFNTIVNNVYNRHQNQQSTVYFYGNFYFGSELCFQSLRWNPEYDEILSSKDSISEQILRTMSGITQDYPKIKKLQRNLFEWVKIARRAEEDPNYDVFAPYKIQE